MTATEHAPIRRALISVSDKTGVAAFAKTLAEEHGVEILSTGGTARVLREAGVTVVDVAEHTGAPEIMDGRVKTLHPKIHGGILGRRGMDDAVMSEQGIAPIDLVVVNLYPFEQTVADPDCPRDQAIETIDIGGPAMLRAAAKNHAFVTLVVDAADYDAVLDDLNAQGGTSTATRRRLAAKGFNHTAGYDRAIADYLRSDTDVPENSAEDELPAHFVATFQKRQSLRYGENPHQRAALYAAEPPVAASLVDARVFAVSFDAWRAPAGNKLPFPSSVVGGIDRETEGGVTCAFYPIDQVVDPIGVAPNVNLKDFWMIRRRGDFLQGWFRHRADKVHGTELGSGFSDCDATFRRDRL